MTGTIGFNGFNNETFFFQSFGKILDWNWILLSIGAQLEWVLCTTISSASSMKKKLKMFIILSWKRVNRTSRKFQLWKNVFRWIHQHRAEEKTYFKHPNRSFNDFFSGHEKWREKKKKSLCIRSIIGSHYACADMRKFFKYDVSPVLTENKL